MRPIKLKIQAFGPYLKPIVLDFERNLDDKKIFLINGATGAGKTTILDAICFALYGTASGDERDGTMMRSKGIPDDTKTTVEFSFALGKKIYNITRSPSYDVRKKRGEGFRTIPPTAELKLDGEVIERQASRVTNAITELLGFNAKQFRQVVLLPQGEFKNFLAAGSADRQPILDALFNAELYKRIEDGLQSKSDAAQKIFDDVCRAKDALTAQLQGAKLDEETLEKIREDYAAAQKKSAKTKKILDEAQGEYTAGKILAGDFAELEQRRKNLNDAQKNFDDAEKLFAAAKIEYDRRDAEQSQREQLKSDVDKLAETKKALAELDTRRKTFDDAEKNLQEANGALKKISEDAEKFDKRLADLKRQRNGLAGAEKTFAKAQTILEKVRDREKILQEISQLEGDLKVARKKISTAEKKFNAAQIELKRLQKLQRDGSAALLAKNLRAGDPCPVCGSETHPHLAYREEIIPSDSEIDAAQEKSDRLKKVLDGAKIDAAQIQTAIDTKLEGMEKFADLPAAAEAQKDFDDAKKAADKLTDCEKRIATGEELIKKNNAALETARKNQIAASNEREKIFGALQTFQSQIPQDYLDNPQKLKADLAAKQQTLRELENAWKSADKNFRAAGNKKFSCEGTFVAAQKSQRELADKLKDKNPPEMETLKARVDSAQKNFNDAIREETSLKNDLERLKNLAEKIAALDEKISAAEKNLRVWKKLSDAAGGKIRGNKLSFARYYLGAMFEQVLTEANYRLEKMSDRRYNLRSKPTAGERADAKLGLNLEIFDDYTGETRPVATLSGGESFLASLSLALGLAAVVRNNLGGIKLDTIFIDEGFGSLDSETLDDAISTIIEQSGGRLVGIISHVEELKNQMPVRLEVFKTKTGSYAKFVS